MQLVSNNCDVDLDILNYYDWHIEDFLRDLFDISINIFCGVYYPTSHMVIM